jgi:hypothetical protein
MSVFSTKRICYSIYKRVSRKTYSSSPQKIEDFKNKCFRSDFLKVKFKKEGENDYDV